LRHALLGVVEVEPRAFGREPLAARRIVREERAKVRAAELRGVIFERAGARDYGSRYADMLAERRAEATS
ncbi:MAG TPA: hypothetical protein PL143_09360, partial [Rhodocyclaceae bacterium]|nr:hypothetical protein [Rhodocyclaceae bacterium]